MKHVTASLGAALAICLSAPAFAQGSTATSQMTQDPGKADSWTYRNPKVALSEYKRFIILPTAVGTSPTSEWGNASYEQKQKYAGFLTEALRKEIGQGYEITQAAGPGTATMKMTLLGVKGTTTGLATASRATPMGLALNSFKSLRGKPGSFTGSVQAAFELTDSQTGELIFAAIRRRSPNALDIESTLSTDHTVQSVADDLAGAIRKGLDKANGR